MPWFSLVFLAGNALPAAVLSLLRAPRPKLSRWWPTRPILWLSRPAPLQRMPASRALPEFIASEAMHVLRLCWIHKLQKLSEFSYETSYMEKQRLNSWLQTKFWKGSNKQQKQLPVYLSLWDFSGAQKPRKQISSALLLQRYLTESASLLRFCPTCDSDSCRVASWVRISIK